MQNVTKVERDLRLSHLMLIYLKLMQTRALLSWVKGRFVSMSCSVGHSGHGLNTHVPSKTLDDTSSSKTEFKHGNLRRWFGHQTCIICVRLVMANDVERLNSAFRYLLCLFRQASTALTPHWILLGLSSGRLKEVSVCSLWIASSKLLHYSFRN